MVGDTFHTLKVVARHNAITFHADIDNHALIIDCQDSTRKQVSPLRLLEGK